MLELRYEAMPEIRLSVGSFVFYACGFVAFAVVFVAVVLLLLNNLKGNT